MVVTMHMVMYFVFLLGYFVLCRPVMYHSALSSDFISIFSHYTFKLYINHPVGIMNLLNVVSHSILVFRRSELLLEIGGSLSV